MAQKLHSVGYSDVDWAGDLDGRRSTSSYLFKFSGAAVRWRSKKQNKCSIYLQPKLSMWHWLVLL